MRQTARSAVAGLEGLDLPLPPPRPRSAVERHLAPLVPLQPLRNGRSYLPAVLEHRGYEWTVTLEAQRRGLPERSLAYVLALEYASAYRSSTD